MSEIILELKNISKNYENQDVLRGISLTVYKGEFLTFLGPSGCGKTTMLRIIAGLIDADGGNVFLNEKNITDLAPNKRNVNTVFQNYALFPHMNVAENIAYGLKIKGVPKNERIKRTNKMLELVQLSGYEKKMPSQLSGGQRQRVAIARAAINEPSILLLDEPLGALDLQLRRYMQTELKQLQKQLGITFIYITHDQEEAMNMSDRVVVMKDGQFEQIGTPSEIYDMPKTSFVAQFVGRANIIGGKVVNVSDRVYIEIDNATIRVPVLSDDVCINECICLSIRSENVELCKEYSDGLIPVKIIDTSYANGLLTTHMQTEFDQVLISTKYGFASEFKCGDTAYARLTHGVILDTEVDSLC